MIKITKYGSGNPLVLFHGWGFDSQIWLPFVAYLESAGFELYLVDLPGFGSSSYMDWESFKEELLLQLPDRFACIGWSLGGLIATRLSIEVFPKVTQLINLTSLPRFIKTHDWMAVDEQVFNAFYKQFTQDPQKTRLNFINAQLKGQTLSDLYLSDKFDTEGLRAGLDCLIDWDLRVQLLDLKIPVCYVFGRLDAIIPRRMMLSMQRLYPNFKYVMIKKAAHAPFLSHPDELLDYLKEFLV